jgi:hypothetical protein
MVQDGLSAHIPLESMYMPDGRNQKDSDPPVLIDLLYTVDENPHFYRDHHN